MIRLVFLCVTWMVLSAVTAYYADIWGRKLGKQRKTIGRLRPKHTAVVIITSAGALIALLSFVVLLTADAGLRRALLHWDQTVAEKRALQIQLVQQKTSLDAQIAAKQDQVNKAAALIASAEARVKTAQARVAEAQTKLTTTQADLTAKQKQLSNVQSSLQRISADLQRTSTQLAKTNAVLKDRQRQLKNAEAYLHKSYALLGQAFQKEQAANAAVERTLHGDVAARANDDLGRIVVPRGVSLSQARETLRRLLNEAGRLVQQRAKGSSYAGKPFVVVRDKYVLQRVNGQLTRVKISGQRSMELAAEQLAGSSVLPGGTVVCVVAVANAMGGDTVQVDFELFANHVVFDKLQEISSFVIKASDGKPAIMTALTGSLKDVRGRALEAGLIPAADGSVGTLPPYQLPDVYFEVRQAFREGQQTVRVRVMAAQETWTSDELRLRFEVRRYTEGS